jgi:hypothetical protein
MLKNYKVGGTSLEVELSKVLPSDAIVTEIYPINNNHSPRNFNGFYNHMSYKNISKSIDLSSTKSYVFVRNPYDMVLSNFFYDNNMNNEWENLNELKRKEKINNYFEVDMLKSSKAIYTDENLNLLVTQVLKYENGIENEINSILPIHNIQKIKINTFEKSFKPKNIKYTDLFSKEQINKIYKEWEWEFLQFGYAR